MPLQPRVMIINAGEYKQKTRDQIRSSGYVIDTLEAAMWSVWNTDNFRDAILLAANLADDADSVAATAGQIAGALYGYSGIPQEWKTILYNMNVSPKWLVNCSIEPRRHFLITVYLNETTGKVVLFCGKRSQSYSYSLSHQRRFRFAY